MMAIGGAIVSLAERPSSEVSRRGSMAKPCTASVKPPAGFDLQAPQVLPAEQLSGLGVPRTPGLRYCVPWCEDKAINPEDGIPPAPLHMGGKIAGRYKLEQDQG